MLGTRYDDVIGAIMTEMRFSVSVIIPNYNYEDFVGAAIESALGLDWPDVEVIVVDDGSTDNSRAVIERYADRVSAIFQENAGHVVACNVGFSRSRGEVVFFLDSDDLLHPSIVRELAAIWRPGISKVQFQMQTIDADGRPLGSVHPQYYWDPSPEEILRWVTTTGAYPTPPGSGNAYARSFLERIFPLDPDVDSFTDSYCLVAAPYLGDVITIPKPLVSYRIHGRNDGAFSQLEVNRFGREVTRAKKRFAYAQQIARSVGLAVPDHAFNKSLATLPYRLASLRLAPKRHPLPGDSSKAILSDVIRAAMAPQGVSLQGRLALLMWAFMTVLSPSKSSEALILWRFAPATRPKFLSSLLRRFRVVR